MNVEVGIATGAKEGEKSVVVLSLLTANTGEYTCNRQKMKGYGDVRVISSLRPRDNT